MIPRGELLAELMRLKFGIAVAGSHGKTTTTSMIATILSHAGLDPTDRGGRARRHDGRLECPPGQERLPGGRKRRERRIVPEARADLAVVTNIDREHLDHYSGLEEIRAAFAEFVSKVPFYGAAILCLDDENVQQILPARESPRRSPTAPARRPTCASPHASAGHLASEFHLRFRGDAIWAVSACTSPARTTC